MAYTSQNIQDAYKQTVGAGAMTEADFVDQAMNKYGVSADQLQTARSGLLASADRYTPEQYSAAQSWASGKSGDEILAKASEVGLTSDELGKVFGTYGGTGQQVTALTGYGSGITNGKPNASYANGVLADGSKTSDWTYDQKTGWSLASKLPKPQAIPAYSPVLNQQVDAPTQTIEGRIQNLLGMDQNGNYTNQVVRQAVDRAMQMFSGRGLLNSSMAQQAAQEAAISKAIEIAGPDAQTYFQQARANQDASNLFARDQTQYGYDLGKIAAQGDQSIRTQDNQNQFTAGENQAGRDFTAGQNQAQRDFTSSERKDTQTWTASENAANRAAQLQASATSASASLQSAGISANTQMQVAEINRTYAQMGNLSSTANSLVTNYFNSVSQIAASDLTADAKDAMINRLTGTLRSGVNLQGAINGDVDMQGMMSTLFPDVASTPADTSADPNPSGA